MVVHFELDSAVRQRLGLAKPEPKKGNSKASSKGGAWKLIREHVYQTADGTPHLRKRKYLKPDGGREFPQARWSGGQWVKGVPKDWPKLLYHLPELLKAPLTSPVYLTEGEADADALAALGFVATTAGGVSSEWTPELAEPLKDRRVVIVVDSDTPGRAYGEKVARVVDPITESLKVVDLFPTDKAAKNGRDVSDFLKSDRAGVNFVKAANDASLWEPSADAGKGDEAADFVDDEAEIETLAKLAPLAYERGRKEAAERLGIRATLLDKLVAARRAELGLDKEDAKQGRAIEFPEPEPWGEPVVGAELLDEIAKAISKHVVTSEASRDAAALWVLHTYLLDNFLVSPRLAVVSPTKQCGKTTLLDVLTPMVSRPLPTANVTPAATFRVIESYRPTLLIDEGDSFLHDNDELRGILNSGHRRGGSVLRTVGESFEPRSFATYSACVIALIGKLPDTLADRSVEVALKRRLPSEKIEPFRLDKIAHLEKLARKAVRWAQDNAERIAAAEPEMPHGIF